MGSFPDFLSWFRVSNHRVLSCSLIFHIRSLVELGWEGLKGGHGGLVCTRKGNDRKRQHY